MRNACGAGSAKVVPLSDCDNIPILLSLACLHEPSAASSKPSQRLAATFQRIRASGVSIRDVFCARERVGIFILFAKAQEFTLHPLKAGRNLA
jgi:hypothetical protein